MGKDSHIYGLWKVTSDSLGEMHVYDLEGRAILVVSRRIRVEWCFSVYEFGLRGA